MHASTAPLKLAVSACVLLLPLAAVCDEGENLLHWELTGAGALVSPWAAACYLVAGLCASGKWAGILVFFMAAGLAQARRLLAQSA